MAKLKIEITPSIQRLNLLIKGFVNTKYIGSYASAFKGQGLEFADYRVYNSGDDANRIDWKASSRARKLLVKEYVEERNINVFFIIDVSSKMMLGSTPKLKCEYVAELVASFAHVVLRAGDFVGLTMFSDKVVKTVPSNNGMRQFQIISDTLSNLSFYGGGSNIKKSLDNALKFLDENTLIILISDFISDDFEESLRLAAKKFKLIGILVRDPRDMTLPSVMGQISVEDPITHQRMLITPNKFKSLYDFEAKKQVDNLEKIFKDVGADFLTLYTNESFVEKLVAFFKMREKRWR